MYRKRDAHITATSHLHLVPIWRDGNIIYSPLYIKKIQLIQPHFIKDAQRYCLEFSSEQIPTELGDKLKFYRYRKGLLQREVTEMVGVSRSCYHAWANGGRVSEYWLERVMGVLVVLEFDL